MSQAPTCPGQRSQVVLKGHFAFSAEVRLISYQVQVAMETLYDQLIASNMDWISCLVDWLKGVNIQYHHTAVATNTGCVACDPRPIVESSSIWTFGPSTRSCLRKRKRAPHVRCSDTSVDCVVRWFDEVTPYTSLLFMYVCCVSGMWGTPRTPSQLRTVAQLQLFFVCSFNMF